MTDLLLRLFIVGIIKPQNKNRKKIYPEQWKRAIKYNSVDVVDDIYRKTQFYEDHTAFYIAHYQTKLIAEILEFDYYYHHHYCNFKKEMENI